MLTTKHCISKIVIKISMCGRQHLFIDLFRKGFGLYSVIMYIDTVSNRISNEKPHPHILVSCDNNTQQGYS